MKKEFRKITRIALILLCIMQFSCEKVLYETYDILEDRSRASESLTAEEDGAGSGMAIWPEKVVAKKGGKIILRGKNYDHIIYEGPYALSISVSAPKNVLRKSLNSVEIDEVYLEIFYKKGASKKIELNANSEKWTKNIGKTRTTFRTSLKMQNIGGGNGAIDIDYDNLKEVRFYIKYTGIYENGDRREYWQERYYIPVHTEERRNGLENMARQ